MKKLILLLLSTTAIVTWIFLFSSASAMSWSSETVVVCQTHFGRYDTQVQCSGTIQPKAERAISYGIPLKPTALHVAVGDTVHAGQVLMDIDRTQSITALTTLSAIENNSALLTSSSSITSNDTSSSTADAQRIQQAIHDWASGNTSQTTSNNNMEALLQQYAGTSDTSQLESQLSSQLSQNTTRPSANSDSTSTESALEQQVPEKVIAPISGTVTQLNANVGSFCAPTANLIVISDLSGLDMCAQVDQSDISSICVGQKAQISTSDAKTVGTITKISPNAHSVSDANGTKSVIDVYIRITQSNPHILSDMSAQATITTNVNPNAISVPYEAVQQDNSGQEYVFVLQHNCVYRRNIKTGVEFSTTVQVLSGLKKNEEVVLSPPSSLKSGIPVLVKGIHHV